MKKWYFIIIFFGFFGFPAFSDTGRLSEIDYLLFSPNSSSRFFDDELATYITHEGGVRHGASGYHASRESRTAFPWLIFILLLLATAALAALLLFTAKLRKNTGRRIRNNSLKENNKPIAVGGKAHVVDLAPIALAGISPVNDSTNGNWHNSSGAGRGKFVDLEKAIRELIFAIPAGVFFDVHTIVEKLLQEHDDVYLMSVGNYTSAAQYHSKISAIIAHELDLVEKMGDSYSKNIHDKFSECHLFRRKK